MSSVDVNPQVEVVSRSRTGWFAGLSQRPLILGAILVIAILAVYYPVHSHPFINYDDNDYVYDNPHVQAGLTWSTIKWACTSSYAANWHPLTWLSHALDCQLFGASPAGPHDVNLLLHTLDAVLLFWVLLRATGYAGRSFMVAALFALHPVNVQSVAWIAERKNMLCMLFFLLALAAYRWYASQPKAGRYVLVAFLFGMGLMAKPQVITLPFLLLLWDYWPLERMTLPFAAAERSQAVVYPARKLSTLIVEKLPLLAIAGVSAVITMKAQHGARNWYPRTARVGNAILSYGLYIRNTFWPTRLAPMYPHAGESISWWHVLLSAVFLAAITGLVIANWRRRYLTVGWCWFLGAMVPMLGIVQVGVQAMADRYAYLSFLGLFLMICWGAADWAAKKRLPSWILPCTSAVIVAMLALAARHQLDYWKNNELIWSHTLKVTRPNWVAEDQLGSLLAMRGQVAEAMPHFFRALALNPQDDASNMAIAIYDQRRNDFAGAIAHYQVVVKGEKEKPKALVQAYTGMAKAYHSLGLTGNEQECLDKAKQFSQ